MERLKLKDVTLDNVKYDNIDVFLHNDGSIALLPSLFSYSIEKNMSYLTNEIKLGEQGITQKKLITQDISKHTAEIIKGKLSHYLYWIELYSKSEKCNKINFSTHHNFPDVLINYYINKVLINEYHQGDISISQSIMALNAYYNWLANAQLTTVKKIGICPKYRNIARSNTKHKNIVKYLTARLRSEFYREAPSRLIECVLRSGGELGLRSCENRGFLLNDFKYNKHMHKGLLSLFDDMDKNQEQQTFEYFLCGTFSKSIMHQGGSSRVLYFNRSLLERFRQYYNLERPKQDLNGYNIKHNSFFLTAANAHFGNPIPAQFGTRAFCKVRKQLIKQQNEHLLELGMQLIEEDQSYHILRHSFGTDLFYHCTEEQNIRIDDVTTTSSTMIQVAKAMGHSLQNRFGNLTTTRYIRLTHEKLSLEDIL